MTYAANANSSVVPFTRRRRPPGPAELPGIEGLYFLSDDGVLGRYQADGRFHEDQDLTRALSTRLHALLSAYRSGESDQLPLALVTPSTPDHPWRSASLVFTNDSLREVYRTSNDPDAPLTAFQKRNKVKSVYRGMELVLDTKKAFQTQYPRFCPVLVAPEISSEALCRRYGMVTVDRRKVLEVLDLTACFSPEEQRHPALSAMVVEMRRTTIIPELRRSPSLELVESGGEPADGGLSLVDDLPDAGSGQAVPNANSWQAVSDANSWQAVPDDADSRLEGPEQQNTCFSDGDPVPFWLLAKFAPFNELNDLQRQFVARGHTISRKRPGTTLIEHGSREDVTIFLVDGTLELEACDGKSMTVVGGTCRARLPVSQLRPHAYTVRAATEVTVILVSQDMVREITRVTTTCKNRPGIEVSEEETLPDCITGQIVSRAPEARRS